MFIFINLKYGKIRNIGSMYVSVYVSVCVCVCIYICMYLCMYVSMYVYMYYVLNLADCFPWTFQCHLL
jgi:hypothetical protein